VGHRRAKTSTSTTCPSPSREIDDQINIMIKQKYTGINYNGITKKNKRTDERRNQEHVRPLGGDYRRGSQHVSRIVNKIPKKRAKPSLNKSTATILYEQLLTAVDVKIVLPGTPIITTRRRCPYYST
jgi:hypothetical protein